MIVTCPHCQTRYQLRPESLGEKGRTVRCSSCGERWFVPPRPDARPAHPPADPGEPAAPAAGAAPTFPTPEPEPEPAPLPAPMAGAPPARQRSILGWLLLTILALLVAGLVVGREEVVARFPEALALYERVGIKVRLPLGVEFRNLSSEQRLQEGHRQLVVRGEIANVASRLRELPPIRVGLLDGERREIGSSRFDPPQPALEPGAIAKFEVTIEEPPPSAQSFTVSFGDPS